MIAKPDVITCGSWLACDADTSVYQALRGDAIAGKPAPTFDLHWAGGQRCINTTAPHPAGVS
ncbi:hypothetical protein EUX58_04235 [Pseudomonas sp. 770NI]|nr:hypothetical protein EUX58_04235 [Pseudomonas sp. 770NI]